MNKNIKEIVCSRNIAIHGDEKPRCKKMTIKNLDRKIILKWFEILNKILCNIV
jgi:hypothetical protein